MWSSACEEKADRKPVNRRAQRGVTPGDVIYRIAARAGIAQLVEQRIRNAWVVGSNPIPGTTLQ